MWGIAMNKRLYRLWTLDRIGIILRKSDNLRLNYMVVLDICLCIEICYKIKYISDNLHRPTYSCKVLIHFPIRLMFTQNLQLDIQMAYY